MNVKQWLKKVGCYLIAFFGGVASFFLGAVLLHKRNGTNDAREQLENLQDDSRRLEDTNRTTEEILTTVRQRKLREEP